MAKIASKQLIRAGDLATLQEKLIERELGLCTTDRLLYVKYGDELIPAGDGAVPVPTSKSLFMGEEDGTSDWTSVVKAESPYDENTELWVSLDDVKFAAEMAYKDADGHDIKSSMFQAYTSSGRAEPPVFAPVNLEKKMGTGLVVIRMGSGNDLGAIIPITPPDADGEFAPGDVLVAKSTANPPFLVWKHPDALPVENSKDPITSGAVYGVRHLIDPNLYDPNTGEEMEITGTDLRYEKGWYYVFGDSLFICDSATSTKAEFTGVDGLVIALNYTLDKIPPVAVYVYETDTNRCRDSAGHLVKAADILTAMADGKMPIMLIRTSRDATVCGTAMVVSGGTSVLFRESPKDNGSFTEYSNDFYSDTYDWTATPKFISGEGIVYVGQGVSFNEVNDIINAGKLPVMRVVAGQGYDYYYPSWVGSGLAFINVASNGDVTYYNKTTSGSPWTTGRYSTVFYAVYGSTTFNDMKAAYDAGKQAFVRLERNSPPITYTFIAPLVNYTDVGSGVKSFYFYVINSSGEWARATLDDSYGWSQSFG